MKIERIAEKIIQSSYEIEVCLYSRSIKRCQKLIIFWISFSGKRLNFEGSLQSNQRIGDFRSRKLSTYKIFWHFSIQKREICENPLVPLAHNRAREFVCFESVCHILNSCFSYMILWGRILKNLIKSF